MEDVHVNTKADVEVLMKKDPFMDYQNTSAGVFTKEEPLMIEDLDYEEYKDSSKAVEVTTSINKDLFDVRTIARVIKEECLQDSYDNGQMLDHIGEQCEAMNAADHHLILQAAKNKPREEFILPDVIGNIHAIEETFKKEPVLFEKTTEASKESSLEVNCRPISIKEELGIFSPEQVSRIVLHPRKHKDYKCKESNSARSGSQEYTPEDIASKQPTPNESTVLHSVHYRSLPKPTMTREFELSEFVTNESCPLESLTYQYADRQSNPQESEDEVSTSEGNDAENHTYEESDTDERNCEDVQMHSSREAEKERMEWSVVEIEHPSKKTCEGDHEEETVYSCNICGKTLVSYASIARHLSYVHSNKRPFQCVTCQKTFKIKNDLTRHSKVHREGKPFSCQVCRKSFRFKHTLVAHELAHSGSSRYNCTQCDKGFERKRDFEEHQTLHDGETIWECDECPESFRQWKEMVEHSAVHRRKKGLICDVCGNKFRRKFEMRKHMLTHTLPHQCDICEKNFSHASILKIHVQSHTGERPFPCTVCKRRFARKPDIVTHMRTHTGERPYACEICGWAFALRGNLNKHLEKKHSHDLPFRCKECALRFDKSKKLKEHKKEMHSNAFQK